MKKETLEIDELIISEPKKQRGNLIFQVTFSGNRRSFVFDQKEGEIWKSSGSLCEVWTVGSYYVLTNIFGQWPFGVIPTGTISKLVEFLQERYPLAEIKIKR